MKDAVFHVRLAADIAGKVRFDDADAERLAPYTWRLSADGYAVAFIYEARDPSAPRTHANRRHRILRMHRIIMQPPSGFEVDHINGDKFDNRRCNLRVVTSSQNHANVGLRKDNKTGRKGVHFDRRRRLWLAFIRMNGRRVHLGRFESKHEATIARAAAEKVMHGEYARN